MTVDLTHDSINIPPYLTLVYMTLDSITMLTILDDRFMIPYISRLVMGADRHVE